MEADGSGRHPVPMPVGAGEPAWSPDGSMIAVVSSIDCGGGETCLWRICTMKADGTERRCLPATNAEGVQEPAWSPDGERIAYTSWDEPLPGQIIETNIYVIDADGSNRRRLTSTRGEDSEAAWSPDGKRIVFSSDRLSGNTTDWDLFVMDSDGRNVQRLTRSPMIEDAPDFSPDGTQIVYSRVTGEMLDFYDIWVMNADGTEQRVVSDEPVPERQPTWSPDGTSIAAVCVSEAEGSDEICVMNADGTNHRPLTHGNTGGLGSMTSPDWAPKRP